MLIRKHMLKKKNRIDIAFLTKVVNMQEKLEMMYSTVMNLGQKYQGISNLWKNIYLEEFKHRMASEYKGKQVDLSMRHLEFENFQNLFHEQHQKMQFFKSIKQANPLSNSREQEAHRQYFSKCQKLQEVPMPAFIKIQQNTLFLSNFNITDQMS